MISNCRNVVYIIYIYNIPICWFLKVKGYEGLDRSVLQRSWFDDMFLKNQIACGNRTIGHLFWISLRLKTKHIYTHNIAHY